jgi:hypothetical protein
VSPIAPPNSLESAIVGDFFGELPSDVITEQVALRVPEVKRALQAHTSLVAPLKFSVFQDGEELATQPLWVTNSASGISPYIRWKGCVRDLFLHGWALLGAKLGADNLPEDLLHIPRDLWGISSDGLVEIDESIPAAYRNPILIPLGANGLLSDGIDSIRQARVLELARQNRLATPPAATELHLNNPLHDEMTKKEKEALSKSYSENRNKYSVAVTPSYIDVKDHNGQTVDLFEAAMNSLRIQIANHAGVPASFIEGGREGGEGSAITYSNENTKQSELWVFGSAEFAYAITARLSMDDVVGPNAEVRADLSSFMNPPATELAPETTPEAETPAPAEPVTE